MSCNIRYTQKKLCEYQGKDSELCLVNMYEADVQRRLPGEEEKANMKLMTRHQPGDRDHRCATAQRHAIIDSL